MKTTRPFPALTAALFLTALPPPPALAQQPKSDPVALPQPVVPANEPALPVKETPPRATPPPAPRTPAKGEILLNFQGASLTDVLNYLSEAAGFVIVQEARVEGTVNVVSRQPISPAEAVDLVNAVLIEKGFIAIRNGRILKIVKREGAQKRDLPVETGSDPEMIPRNDEMVTQILPLRYGEAGKLIENLRPLLADSATISANDSSNSLLLTDTRTNIRRIAQIIRAIDTSVASISTIHVYPLRFANAKDLATVVSQLFLTSTANSQTGRGGRGGFGGFGGFGGGGGGRDGGQGGQAPAVQSEAKQAASRVVAVADEQSNSLIVSAPEDLIPQITDIIEKLDTSISDITESRIFRLQHADAAELATILTSLYPDTTTQGQNNQGRNRGFGGGFGGGGQGGQNQAAPTSQRALLQSKVVAVGDPRTNSLVVTAARDTMAEIAETVGRLDSTDAKKQRVYIHSLEHADADSVATVLRGMLGDPSAAAAAQQTGANRLTNRSATGATIDTAEAANGGGGGGRTGR